MYYGQPEVSDDKPEFAPGDFVWGRLKNKRWWPGQVQDHDSASAEKKPRHREDSSTPIRVVFFGNSMEASLSSAQFKPFVSEFGNSIVASSFTGKSGYGRGAGFFGAVTKAAGELRKCVESGLSCRCVSKVGRYGDGDPIRPRDAPEGSSGLGFGEVEEFVRVLHGVASGAWKVDLVEASVMQGRLSAYLRWVGRWNRPLPDYHQCEGIEDFGGSEEKHSKRRNSKKERSMADLISDTVETPVKKRDAEERCDGDQSSRRRSRKKSKYLSPPYTLMEKNKNRSKTKEDESKAIVPYESSPAANSGNPNPPKKRTRRGKKKFSLDDGVSTNLLLSEFQLLALDTNSLPSEKMVRGFFDKFRSSVYVNGSDYENYCSKMIEPPQILSVDINTPIAVADADSPLNQLDQSNSVEVGLESKNKRVRKKKKSISCELGDLSPPATAAEITGNGVECLENGKKKKGRKKKASTSTTTTDIVVSPQTNPKPPLNFVQKSLEKMITTLKNSSGEREKLAEEMSGLLIKVNKMLSNAAADVKDSTAATTPTTTAAT